MQVEVVFAMPDKQVLETVLVPEGATVEDAIRRSGIERRFPGEELASLSVGIWGRLVERDRVVEDGDRVEIYRPLAVDPREARRLKAGS